MHLLHLYRKSRTMPPKLRSALRETIEDLINLYIKSSNEIKSAARAKKKKEAVKGDTEQ